MTHLVWRQQIFLLKPTENKDKQPSKMGYHPILGGAH